MQFSSESEMMSSSELLSVARRLCAQDLRRVSDADLCGLVRSGVDLMFLFSCGLLGDSSDEASFRQFLLRRVYPSLRRRYALRRGLCGRWPLLDASFQLLHYASPFYDGREESCTESLAGLLSGTDVEEVLRRGGESLYCYLSASVRHLYGLRDFDPPLPDRDSCASLVDETVSSWAVSLGPDGSWSGVGGEEALFRLRLMDMNSYMLLDSRYDGLLSRACKHYCVLPVPSDTVPDDAEVRRSVLMYDVLDLSSRLPADCSSRLLESLSRRLSSRPDSLLAESVVVSHACRLLGRSANQSLGSDAPHGPLYEAFPDVR